jgi:hypothetical protein
LVEPPAFVEDLNWFAYFWAMAPALPDPCFEELVDFMFWTY